MIKILSTILIFSAVSISAQISITAKVNSIVQTSTASWKNLKTAGATSVEQNGKNITGFNLGLSLKVDLPSSFYLMPEVYYTNFKNEAQFINSSSGDPITIEARSSRVDIPFLLGYSLLGNKLSAYIGPVGSFNLTKNENYQSFTQKINTREFSVGYQFGIQSEISKIVISVRYEGALSKDERKFVNTVAGSQQEINYDNRTSIFLVGLGYRL